MFLTEIFGFQLMANEKQEMTFNVAAPASLTPEQFRKVKQLLMQGNQVNAGTLDNMLIKAKLVAFASIGKNIVGIGAIKTPNPSYKTYLTNNTGINVSKFQAELGYLVTSHDYQNTGISSKLTKLLLDNFTGPVYATVRVPNYVSMHLLKNNGFKKTGNVFTSDSGNDISLWVRV